MTDKTTTDAPVAAGGAATTATPETAAPSGPAEERTAPADTAQETTSGAAQATTEAEVAASARQGPALAAEEDTPEGEEGYETDQGLGSDKASETTSLASSILAYRQENGRTYHAYKDGAYVLPNDETENERLDLQHNLFLMTFDSKLHCAPLDKTPRRVLDAGCGTGIWAIDFADEHPETEVIGIDLSPIQPPFVPPNVSFFIDDLEDEWEFNTKFDFIFSRFMTGSILDWKKYIRQCYDNLEPGGKVELMDILYPLLSDDGTLTDTHAIKQWTLLLNEGFAGAGRSMTSGYHYKEWLAEAGFVDIVEVKEKWPINGWPKSPKYKQIGLWTAENLTAALGALSLAIFTRPIDQGGLGWKPEELEALLMNVRKDFKKKSIHAYWPIWSVYATKPM